MRAAYSPIVRDAMDFSTAICDGAGRPLAQGLTTPLHLGSFHDAMRFVMRAFAGALHEGDILIGNDPYIAAGQHLPDIYIVRPIFLAGTCAGFATTVAHHVDVGGIIPGSNALGAHEIYQEGLRLPFLKLYDARRAQRRDPGDHRSQRTHADPGGGRPRGADRRDARSARAAMASCSRVRAPRRCRATSRRCTTTPRPWRAASSRSFRTAPTASSTTSTDWASIPNRSRSRWRSPSRAAR